jgi:hypothetical protein
MLLFSRNFTEYGRFKDFLSLYFLFEQQGFLHGHIHLLLYKEQFDSQKANDERRKEYDLMKDIENPFDARYSQLVGSIFDSTSIDKPSDSPVRVITWNYDLQLERLFSQIRDTSFFESYIDLNGDKFDSTHKSTDISKIFITRLNGFAGFLKDDKFKFPSLDNQVEIITEFLEYCLTILSNTSQKKRANGLYFSWDEHANSQKFRFDMKRDIATSILENTEKLIIIGYSFPNYNRKVDNQLLKHFSGTVHVQNPNYMDNADSAWRLDRFQEIEKFQNAFKKFGQAISKEIFTGEKDVSQFYIPSGLHA